MNQEFLNLVRQKAEDEASKSLTHPDALTTPAQYEYPAHAPANALQKNGAEYVAWHVY